MISKNYDRFLSTDLWTRFFVYRAFVGRMVLLDGRIKSGKAKVFWTEDNLSVDLLRQVISDDEIEAMRKKKINGPTKILGEMEIRIVREIHDLVSGGPFAKETLRQAEALQLLHKAEC